MQLSSLNRRAFSLILLFSACATARGALAENPTAAIELQIKNTADLFSGKSFSFRDGAKTVEFRPLREWVVVHVRKGAKLNDVGFWNIFDKEATVWDLEPAVEKDIYHFGKAYTIYEMPRFTLLNIDKVKAAAAKGLLPRLAPAFSHPSGGRACVTNSARLTVSKDADLEALKTKIEKDDIVVRAKESAASGEVVLVLEARHGEPLVFLRALERLSSEGGAVLRVMPDWMLLSDI